MTDRVLILDFGSQVTQLIARRIREAGPPEKMMALGAKPAIFCGSVLKGMISQ